MDTYIKNLINTYNCYISKKNINGKEQYYLQWTMDGKKKSKYINHNILNSVKELIDQKKTQIDKYSFVSDNNLLYLNTNVLVNDSLYDFIYSVKDFKKRKIYNDLNDYLYSDSLKVFILYGLRRTGKTTIIKQAILNMNELQFSKTAFIQITKNDTLASLNADIKVLKENGYKYLFIDEVTLLSDFIEGASLFSDIYTQSNMKIVLSGTDSLGFIIAKNNQLFDRCHLVHTTFIPYKEFEKVLNIKGIDNYIQYGGTMSISGNHYNDSIFANTSLVDEYIDSSIANNIQHSLKNYQNEGHFRSLYELYKNKELTNAINRIIEDINHRFTIEIITKEFVSNDLALSAKNLRNNINEPNDILDIIDTKAVTNNLIKLLQIKNELTIDINEDHVNQIQEYLKLLELIDYIDINYLPLSNDNSYKIVFNQPGLRYCQAKALIESLMEDSLFSSIDAITRKYIIQRILSEIKGRMMEDIVLLETKLAKKDLNVFKLQFSVGEYDMVTVDKQKLEVNIYEIKHSNKIINNQTRFLINEEMLKQTAHRYGTIISKNVIYNGPSKRIEDINYINVEEYLNNLN